MALRRPKLMTDDWIEDVTFSRRAQPSRDGKRQVITTQKAYSERLKRGLTLLLIVSYGGSKTFRALTYSNGKPKTHKLGTWPDLKVEQAKERAREYYKDPEKFTEKTAPDTFKAIAQEWIKRHVDENKLRSKPEIERCLKQYVYPKWGSRRFLEIRRRQVNELLDGIVDKHGRSQADAVLAIIRNICNWYAANRSEDYVSPIVAKMRRDKRKPIQRQRKRVLNDDEVRRLWKVCTPSDHDGEDEERIDPAFGALVRLLLLTGQRREKIATLRWDDIDADGYWTVRGGNEDGEKPNLGRAKLPKIALEIIEEQRQRRISGNPYVFPGSPRGRRRNKDRPHKAGPLHFNSFSQRKAELDEKLGEMPDWVLHDLRRTARTLMAKAGVAEFIADRTLGHVIPGMGRIYNRFEYEAEKSEALNRLATLIDSIINPPPANVLPIKRRRART